MGRVEAICNRFTFIWFFIISQIVEKEQKKSERGTKTKFFYNFSSNLYSIL